MCIRIILLKSLRESRRRCRGKTITLHDNIGRTAQLLRDTVGPFGDHLFSVCPLRAPSVRVICSTVADRS